VIVPLGVILAGYLYILGDAVTTAHRHRATFQPQWYNTWYVYLAIIGLAAFVLQPTVGSTLRSRIRAFKIPSESMETTLFIGDHLLVKRSRVSDTPLQRFAVIVYHYPWAEKRDFVKRIIALPGEWVQLRDRQVSINDQPLQEPFAYYSAPGRYSALGDKRDDNYDSRYWGFVPRANIVGIAKRLYWSWDDAAKGVRWERIGQEIR
jgi:signal peptidase I